MKDAMAPVWVVHQQMNLRMYRGSDSPNYKLSVRKMDGHFNYQTIQHARRDWGQGTIADILIKSVNLIGIRDRAPKNQKGCESGTGRVPLFKDDSRRGSENTSVRYQWLMMFGFEQHLMGHQNIDQ